MAKSERSQRDRTDPTDSNGDDALDPRDEIADTSFSDDATGVSGRPSERSAGTGGMGDIERELTDSRDRYLRLAAEYDNYRKRTAKERADAESRGQAGIVKQLLDPLDDLSRFAHVDSTMVDPATIVQGVEMVEKKLLKMLAGLGLEILDPQDQTFDPTLHEAVATEPAKSPEDDHVVARVFQQGYRFNGQLLRPARVVVKQWNG